MGGNSGVLDDTCGLADRGLVRLRQGTIEHMLDSLLVKLGALLISTRDLPQPFSCERALPRVSMATEHERHDVLDGHVEVVCDESSVGTSPIRAHQPNQSLVPPGNRLRRTSQDTLRRMASRPQQ